MTNAEYQRRYREANRERLRKYEKIRSGSTWRRRQKAASYRRTAAHVKAYVASWRKLNPEKFKAWYTRENFRRRARLAGVPYEPIEVAEIARRDRNRCGICGGRVLARDRSIDHKVPLAKGGPHLKRNVQLAHLSCNKAKGAR